MGYRDKSIIKDVNKKPVPQYYNPAIDNFEVVEGKNGMLKAMLYDSQGNEIVSQDLVNQVVAKLDELIEVVK